MEKLKHFVFGHRYYFVILGLLLLYEWVVVGQLQIWRTGIVAYEFHAVDFSMGFGSFILPGAVYQRICGPINESSLTVYHTVLLLVFFFVLRLFRSGADADRKKKKSNGADPGTRRSVVSAAACPDYRLCTVCVEDFNGLPAVDPAGDDRRCACVCDSESGNALAFCRRQRR